jgi:3-hydroxyisobutyrate dehydrogenase-like beta-hydroxyacid dehydrogenase
MNEKINAVGFIGLGRMGKPMAANLLRAGFNLVVHDARDGPALELANLGAKVARSPREAVQEADLVEIVVVDDAQVEDVLLGDGGVLQGIRGGTIIAIHSTVYPETIKRMAGQAKTKGAEVIDAPVSGGEAGAREKTLCYMAGGDIALLERCREVFSTSASEIFHMGALGSGAAAKMIVQVVTCINMLAAHEAELLADRGNLDFGNLQKVLHASSGQSFVADNWLNRFKLVQDPAEIRRRRTEVFQQSLAPAIEMARQLGLSLPGAALAERLLPEIMGIEDS